MALTTSYMIKIVENIYGPNGKTTKWFKDLCLTNSSKSYIFIVWKKLINGKVKVD